MIRCIWCERLCNIYRSKKQRQKHTLVFNQKKQIGPTLTPNRARTFKALNRSRHKTQKLNLRQDLSTIKIRQYLY